MNRSKKLCVLLGVLALVCGATLIVLQVEEHQEKIRNSEEIILEVPGDSVQSLSWEYEGETLAFHKEEAWLYDGDSAFPVSEERINELLEPFQAFGVSFVIEDVEDYGQYGLDDPVCTIDLATEELSWQIQLGDYSSMDSKRYVSIGDGNVYLVQNDPLDRFDTDLRGMIANDDTPWFDDVTEIRFSGRENYSVVYEEDSDDSYSPDDVYFARLGETKEPVDTGKVENYLYTISSMKPTDYVTYNATDEDLASYGLDTPELTVSVDYTAEDEDGNEEQNTFVLHVSRTAEGKKAAEAAAEKAEKEADGSEDTEDIPAYVRIGDSKIIYEISSDRYDQLMAAFYDDLRHSELFWGELSEVQKIDVSLEGAVYTFTPEKDGDEYIWSYQEETLESDDFQDALTALTAEEFTTEAPAQKQEVGLTIYLDNEQTPEVRIRLYRYDGTRCLASVDGESAALVDREAVVQLMEAVHAVVLK